MAKWTSLLLWIISKSLLSGKLLTSRIASGKISRKKKVNCVIFLRKPLKLSQMSKFIFKHYVIDCKEKKNKMAAIYVVVKIFNRHNRIFLNFRIWPTIPIFLKINLHSLQSLKGFHYEIEKLFYFEMLSVTILFHFCFYRLFHSLSK